MLALELGLLALVLAGPGPVWVARWGFLLTVPRAAVVLWQAGAIAALIAVFGAGLVAAQELSEAASIKAALIRWGLLVPGFGRHDTVYWWSDPAWTAVLLFALVVAGRLAWSVIVVALQTTARRNRHRAAVDLLGQVAADTPVKGLRVLAAQLPMAYCLPGLRSSRVVLSAGTLAVLTAEELRAVIEHETAHIRARHDVVLDTFTALHRAFPHLVRSELPISQATLLVEMLADDAARRRVGPRPLAHALIALSGAPTPAGALAAAGTDVVLRVRRLSQPAPPRWLAPGVYLLAGGLVALPLGMLIFG